MRSIGAKGAHAKSRRAKRTQLPFWQSVMSAGRAGSYDGPARVHVMREGARMFIAMCDTPLTASRPAVVIDQEVARS
jgi:hypothetical protein